MPFEAMLQGCCIEAADCSPEGTSHGRLSSVPATVVGKDYAEVFEGFDGFEGGARIVEGGGV